MNTLTVLYDAACGFCVRCRDWLSRQPQFVTLEFCPAGSEESARRFPGLETSGKVEELVVIDDEGGIYRGAQAWLMCLWALVEYREWSGRLASPALLPLARGAFAFVSSRRRKVSVMFGFAPETGLIQELRKAEPPHCVDVAYAELPDQLPTITEKSLPIT
jgi:predicted DCC family thiol-disulfide oxidoreductase YuxK